jgi:hypothetical protein
MKKSFLISFLFILTFLPAFSQQENVTAGIRGGLNMANLYISEVSDENVKFGINGGIYVRNNINRFIGIQSEFFFISKGAEVFYEKAPVLIGSSQTGTYKYNLNYLELPVLAVFRFTPNFNFHAGPYVATLISANVKDKASNGEVKKVTEMDKNQFNTFDYGLAGGLQFDFETGMLGLRYNYGLREIGKRGTFAGQHTTDSKNSVLQVYLGFKF